MTMSCGVSGPCWRPFDQAVGAGTGKKLRSAAREGGRDLEGVGQHVLAAGAGYLARLGWKLEKSKEHNLGEELGKIRPEILKALASAARVELSTHGPRGGIHWMPRYFVRRSAWHVLDHAWEIENRVT
jgi:hypothetical protein